MPGPNGQSGYAAVYSIDDKSQCLHYFSCPVCYPKWSPDGRYIAFGKEVYDLNSQIWLQAPLEAICYDSCWSPDATKLAILQGSTIHVFQIQDMEKLYEAEVGADSQLSGVCWSPDGKYIAVGGNSTQAGIYFSEDGSPLRLVADERDAQVYYANSWTPNSRWAIFETSGTTLLVDCQSNTKRMIGGVGSTPSLSPDQSTLVTWNPWESTLDWYSLNSGERISQEATPIVSDLSIAPRQSIHIAAICTNSSETRIVRFINEPAFITLPSPKSPNAVSWGVDQQSVYSGDPDDTGLRIWNLQDHTFRDLSGIFSGQIASETISSPLGRYLLASCDSGSAILDISNDEWTHRIQNSGPTAWYPDGQRFLVQDAVYNVQSGAKLFNLQTLEGATASAASISPDGKLIAIAGTESQIFDARNGNLLHEIQTTDSDVLHWAQDSQSLWGANYGDTVFEYDLNSNETSTKHIVSPRSRDLEIEMLERFIVNCDYTGAVRVFDLATLAQLFCWLPIGPNEDMIIHPSGHWRGSPGMEDKIVYVVETIDGQETLTPVEMEQKYGWVNDPSQVVIEWPEPPDAEDGNASTENTDESEEVSP